MYRKFELCIVYTQTMVISYSVKLVLGVQSCNQSLALLGNFAERNKTEDAPSHF